MKYLIWALLFVSYPLSSQNVYKITDLIFPVQVQGVGATVTVGVNDAGAATFTATGTAGRSATIKLTSKTVTITTPPNTNNNYRITVNNFVINNTSPVFNALGQITNIRVGARATIVAADVEGEYSGTNTLRLTYL